MTSSATPAIRSLWPNKLLGPPPGLKELNVLCWGSFLLLLLIPTSIFAYLAHRAGKQFSDLLPIDFIYYYGDGQIVNQYPPERLYDSALQQTVFNRIYPLTGGGWSISPYPPLVAQLFSFYAQLPIAAAYGLWFVTSLVLYSSGCLLAFKAAFREQPVKVSLLLFFALIFPPFLYFTLVVGQLSTVAVFALGGAVYFERRSMPLAGGAVLSILSYKPILLFLILPMLLLTRRFRMLLGYTGGVAFFISLATALSGIRIWSAYAGMIHEWLRGAGVHGQAVFRRSLLVDLNSFLYAVPGGRSMPVMLLACALAVALLAWGIWLLWRSANASEAIQHLVWAVVITWTLMLNIYAPIYDCSILAISVGLTLGALSSLQRKSAVTAVGFIGMLIFVTSIFTGQFAEQHGLQIITLVIAALGLLQIGLLHKAIASRQLLKCCSGVPSAATLTP